MTEPQRPAPRRLTRSNHRMLGGVCSGIADHLGVDTTVVRLLTVVAGVVFFPLAPLAYLVCWLVMPER